MTEPFEDSFNDNESSLVSIIVPVYNVEKYISQCIKSLIGQSYQNIEIILINDGSLDNSGKIIDSFGSIDKRIIAIHKHNGGVSSARNAGLNVATGNYIMFVDGDDYVESDYVSYFLSIMNETRSDIGVGKSVFSYKDKLQNDAESLIIENSLDVIEGIYLNHYGVAVWNKIYRRSIIVENKLLFNEDFWYGEGMLFNIMYLQYSDLAVIGNRKVYHVTENPNSATRLFKIENQECGMRSMHYQKDHWKKTNKRVQMAWEYHYRLYAKNILRGLIVTDTIGENKKVYHKCINILRSNIRIPLQCGISIFQKECSIQMAISPTGFIRDELGRPRKKDDFSDVISHRLMLKVMKLQNRIPEHLKSRLFRIIKNYYYNRYKPVYLDRPLF